MRKLLQRPDLLFLTLAVPVGLVLCILIPPLGGGNETHNFERVSGIAYGQLLVGPAEVPAGIVDFIDEGFRFFHQGLDLPFSYPTAEYSTMAGIALRAEAMSVVPPNVIVVHHPFSYVPQALLVRLLAALGASPLTLFLGARIAGLLSALALTFVAIRNMPSHRYALAALALLPPIVYSRSTVDADPLTNALAFLFIAGVLRATLGGGVLPMRHLVGLAALAFVIAQCKSAYLVLPFAVLAIPARRFPSSASRWFWMAALILPGVMASLGWIVLVKHSLFAAGVNYTTWSGAVDPDAQLAWVLQHPIDYAGILLRKVFLTNFLLRVLVEMLGLFGPPVLLGPALVLPLLALFGAAILADPTKRAKYPTALLWLGPLIVVAFTAFALTLLYVQWTALGSYTIDGFQGRYLYPLTPLLLVLMRVTPRRLAAAPGCALLASGAFGIVAMLWKVIWAYYG